jgi:hypothetical protein
MAKPAARAALEQARKDARSRSGRAGAERDAAPPVAARAQPLAPALPGPLEPEPEEEGWVAYPMEDLGPTDPADVARYIAQMTRELSAMAAHARLETLSYLLSMSAAEAEIAAQEAEGAAAADQDPRAG